jgi:hypothetical protein
VVLKEDTLDVEQTQMFIQIIGRTLSRVLLATRMDASKFNFLDWGV